MLLKKLYFSFFIALSATIAHSHAMQQEEEPQPSILYQAPILQADDNIINGAAFYTIHGYKTHYSDRCFCVTSGRGGIMHNECDRHACTSRDLFAHTTNFLIVTYHDKNWKPLAIVDITDLNMQQPFDQIATNFYMATRMDELQALHLYCRSHLDPTAKPHAFDAVIESHRDQNYINFYGEQGEHIGLFPYTKKNNFLEETEISDTSQFEIEQYLDLSQMKKIYDNASCIIL